MLLWDIPAISECKIRAGSLLSSTPSPYHHHQQQPGLLLCGGYICFSNPSPCSMCFYTFNFLVYIVGLFNNSIHFYLPEPLKPFLIFSSSDPWFPFWWLSFLGINWIAHSLLWFLSSFTLLLSLRGLFCLDGTTVLFGFSFFCLFCFCLLFITSNSLG